MKNMHYFSWEIVDIPYVYMWAYWTKMRTLNRRGWKIRFLVEIVISSDLFVLC